MSYYVNFLILRAEPMLSPQSMHYQNFDAVHSFFSFGRGLAGGGGVGEMMVWLNLEVVPRRLSAI